MKTKIKVGNLSDIGKKRTANEDYFGRYSGIYGDLIIVCDGMGGNKGGFRASRLAVEVIKEEFEKIRGENYDPKTVLREALAQADKKMKKESAENPELKEMGSTAVILLIKGNEAYTAHIGDSRIYMIRDGNIHQLTKDHSLVQQMVDGGIISAEKAKDHPNKNVIVRSLGADGSSEPEIAEPFSVFKGDYFILCTDGLTAYLDEYEIKEVVTTNNLQNACKILVDTANERGGKDNITVQIVNVVKGKRLPLKPQTKTKIFYGLGVVILAILLFFTYPMYSNIFNNITKTDNVNVNVPKPNTTKTSDNKEGDSTNAVQDSNNAKKDNLINNNDTKVKDKDSIKKATKIDTQAKPNKSDSKKNNAKNTNKKTTKDQTKNGGKKQ